MLERIFSFVQEKKVVLPIEVASQFGMNSFLAAAYLEQLVNSKKISRSKERIGDAYVYYMPGYELLAEQRIVAAKSVKVTPANYGTPPNQTDPELEKKRELFLQKLKEIEEREKSISAKSTSQEKPKKETKKKILLEQAISIIKKLGAKIIKNSPEELHIKYDSPFGPMVALVFIKEKKSISDVDLAYIYSRILETNMPAILITKGKLTKRASEYLSKRKGLLKVFIPQDL